MLWNNEIINIFLLREKGRVENIFTYLTEEDFLLFAAFQNEGATKIIFNNIQINGKNLNYYDAHIIFYNPPRIWNFSEVSVDPGEHAHFMVVIPRKNLKLGQLLEFKLFSEKNFYPFFKLIEGPELKGTPELMITKNMNQEDGLVITIFVANIGNKTAKNIEVSDNVPFWARYVSGDMSPKNDTLIKIIEQLKIGEYVELKYVLLPTISEIEENLKPAKVTYSLSDGFIVSKNSNTVKISLGMWAIPKSEEIKNALLFSIILNTPTIILFIILLWYEKIKISLIGILHIFIMLFSFFFNIIPIKSSGWKLVYDLLSEFISFIIIYLVYKLKIKEDEEVSWRKIGN
jgi:hypothetical protein